VRHSEPNSSLQLSKQEARFDSGRGEKRRGSDLAMQSDQRCVFWARAKIVNVQTDITATSNLTLAIQAYA
jgi:hypothetical protein